ncbi:hypothetical protein NQ317_014926 [Molorchus minor]|uniref:F-box domain-containing protein n=1 Tax=Molorchus minor TaxID=1323400 RepID=A0ABQ9K1J1_9CUCU|nr:hypothetical protein NQ317_014926 [Molorchus minor]
MCLNIWRITHGPHLQPKQKNCPLEDVPYDKFLQDEIKNVFGESVCRYLIDLGENKRKLENLPAKIFLNILKFLSVNDILHLSQTSKILRELCDTELFWCMMFKKVMRKTPSCQDKIMAFDYNWREVLKMRKLLSKKVSKNQLKEKEEKPPTTQEKKKPTQLLRNRQNKPLATPKRNMIRSK